MEGRKRLATLNERERERECVSMTGFCGVLENAISQGWPFHDLCVTSEMRRKLCGLSLWLF